MTVPTRPVQAASAARAPVRHQEGVAHPVTWVLWLVVVLVWLLSTRNPLYLALICLCVALVEASLPTRDRALGLPFSPWRLGLVIIPVTSLFNAIFAPFGRTVLFEWPAGWPGVEGVVTAEGLAFGALNGVVLVGMIAVFAVLTRALTPHALIRLIPRAFHPVAVTAALALTLVPATLRQFHQIREAQAVRGHRLRGPRDWLPLFVPLLVGGLERALQLAEAMTARGFASHNQPIASRMRALLILSLLAVLLGGVAYTGWQLPWGGPLALAGGALTGGLLWQMGRLVPHTSYRVYPWRLSDGLVLALLVIASLPLLPLPLLDRASLFYHPYPELHWPPFALGIAVALLALLAPVLWNSTSARS